MKSARNALLLASVATLGLVGIGANLQPATAMSAPAPVVAQSQGYTQDPCTILSQTPDCGLVGVYRRKIVVDGVNKEWWVGKTSDGKYVLLTINGTNADGTRTGLTPDGELVKFR